MVIAKLYELPNGTKLRYPILIVSTPEECFKYVVYRNGKSGRRHLPNRYTLQQWSWRCATLVSSQYHGNKYDPSCDGIPYCYFAHGEEGNPNAYLGEPATEHEKMISHNHHLLYRDDRIETMKTYNANLKIRKQNNEA